MAKITPSAIQNYSFQIHKANNIGFGKISEVHSNEYGILFNKDSILQPCATLSSSEQDALTQNLTRDNALYITTLNIKFNMPNSDNLHENFLRLSTLFENQYLKYITFTTSNTRYECINKEQVLDAESEDLIMYSDTYSSDDESYTNSNSDTHSEYIEFYLTYSGHIWNNISGGWIGM